MKKWTLDLLIGLSWLSAVSAQTLGGQTGFGFTTHHPCRARRIWEFDPRDITV